MDIVNAIIDRLLVVLRAAPTYLVAVAMVAGILLDELPALGNVPAGVVSVLAGVVAVVTVAVVIIRRVTPVIEAARGILPPEAGTPYTEAELDYELELAKRPPAA